jgi:cyclohexa-1,5-dienecarbonyl-CoA hydratase
MTGDDARRVRSKLEREDSVLRLVLDAPPGNVLDRAMMEEVTAAVLSGARVPSLRAIVLEGAGEHFSYGASIPEHRKELVGPLLRSFRDLFSALAEVSIPLVALLRGQCLGGGLELASFCHFLIASPSTRLGQPEIRLGVLAPVASLLLPWRIGPTRAEELLLTGRILSADEARDMGLVHTVADNPEQALGRLLEEGLLPHSAVALRQATRAAREGFSDAFLSSLERLELRYVDELMRAHDPNEGIAAFLEKRSPVWRHR